MNGIWHHSNDHQMHEMSNFRWLRAQIGLYLIDGVAYVDFEDIGVLRLVVMDLRKPQMKKRGQITRSRWPVLLKPHVVQFHILDFRPYEVGYHRSISLTIDGDRHTILFSKKYGPITTAAVNPHQTVTFCGCIAIWWTACGLVSSHQSKDSRLGRTIIATVKRAKCAERCLNWRPIFIKQKKKKQQTSKNMAAMLRQVAFFADQLRLDFYSRS